MGRFLVVDDSLLSRKSASNILRSQGHETVEAINGQDALAKVEQETPDCIMLDLLMPEMDGFEVLENLRGRNCQIPVIVCSADIQDRKSVV